MKTPKSALYKRTVSYRRGGTTLLGTASAILFASAPLGVMLWMVPGYGIA